MSFLIPVYMRALPLSRSDFDFFSFVPFWVDRTFKYAFCWKINKSLLLHHTNCILSQTQPKMANPSTQVPSNAITTEIIFAQEFSQVSYTLLEIPKNLESFLKENQNNGLR